MRSRGAFGRSVRFYRRWAGVGAIAGEIRGIREGEIAEFDFAGDFRLFRNGRVAVVDLRLRVQDVVEAASAGGAALENVGDPAERDHWPNEEAEIGIEGDQSAERNLTAQKLIAALPEHNEEGCADHRLERRHKQAPGANQLDVSRDVLAIRLVEAANLGFFLCVGADDANT